MTHTPASIVAGRVDPAAGAARRGNAEALARLVTREIGKPYTESLGEVTEIVDTTAFSLGEGRRLYGQTVASEVPDKADNGYVYVSANEAERGRAAQRFLVLPGVVPGQADIDAAAIYAALAPAGCPRRHPFPGTPASTP